MGLKIGNRVFIKNETTVGIVKNINHKKALVTTDDGFDIWYDLADIKVYQDDLEQLTHIVKKDNTLQKSRSKENKSIPKVVDLHIKKTNETSGNLLAHQLEIFESFLQKGMRGSVSEMTFIHGMGDGILRNEIEKILKKKHLKYSDASYVKYGLDGAITVYFY